MPYETKDRCLTIEASGLIETEMEWIFPPPIPQSTRPIGLLCRIGTKASAYPLPMASSIHSESHQ